MVIIFYSGFVSIIDFVYKIHNKLLVSYIVMTVFLGAFTPYITKHLLVSYISLLE